MLKMLDEGRSTDSKGAAVNFRSTTCIFSSSIGSREILYLGQSGKIGDQYLMKEHAITDIKDHLTQNS